MIKTPNSAELEFTVHTAQAAGKILHNYFGTKLTRTIKRDEEDFVTEADIAAEEVIIAAIQKEFPNDAIIAEESGVLGDENAEWTWTIDPLDGTWNFANGKKNFGTMISRIQGNTVVLSVIYNPIHEILAAAEQGKGATVNGKLVTRSFPSSLRDCRPISGWINDFPHADAINSARDRLQAMGIQSKSLRSVASNVHAILMNKRDCYFSNVAQPWDRCPMIPLLEEAGLIVSSIDNSPFSYTKPTQGFVAAPPSFHRELIDFIAFSE